MTTEKLKKYVVNKLNSIGFSESDIAQCVIFSDKCDQMGVFVFCKGKTIFCKYMGFRKDECFVKALGSADEAVTEVIKHIEENARYGNLKRGKNK